MTIFKFFFKTFALCKEYRVCVLYFKLTRIELHSRISMCSFPLLDCFSTTNKTFRAPFCGEICNNSAITTNVITENTVSSQIFFESKFVDQEA